MRSISKSLYWSIASKIASRGLVFLSSVVLTRYLSPQDFGVVSLSLIYIGFINLFIDAGFGQAIIQKKEISELELSSCYWFLMSCGILAILCTYFCVPVISFFLDSDDIKNFIVVQSLIFFALPLRVVSSSILSRELKIDLLAKVDAFWMVIKFSASVVMAIGNYGVWSLVVPTVLAEFAVAVTLMGVCGWRPQLRFSYSKMKPLASYGLDITGSRIVWYFNTRADQFIIGRFLGSEVLGIYSLAQSLTSAILQFAVSFSQITFPLLSKQNGNMDALRSTFQKINRLTNDFYMPILVGVIITAPDLVNVLFKEQWVDVVFPLQILCLLSIFRINESNVGLMLNAIGHSRNNFYFNCLSLFLILPILYISCKNCGMHGLLIGLTLIIIPLTIIITSVCCRKIQMPLKQYYLNIYPTLKIVLLMGVVVIFINFVLLSTSSLLRLALVAFSGCVLYVFLIYVMEPSKWREILSVTGIKKFSREA